LTNNSDLIKYSVLWSLFDRYLPSIVQIASTLLIARLLSPIEFGEVALVTVFIQIASLLIASGFAEALIFRVKNSDVLYSTVFYLNILFAIILYFILYIFSNNIANYYGISRLGFLSKIIGVNIILYALTYIQRLFYTLAQNFRTPALVVLVSTVLGSTLGIVLAYNNYGVWALVYQTLLINLIQVFLFWYLSSWKPIFAFSYSELKLILPFSLRILTNNIVFVFYENLYTLVIGKYFSSATLGFYNRMQTILYFSTTNLMYSLESVYYTKLCIRKNDKDHLLKSYEVISRVTTYIGFPILIVLIVLGEPIITIVLTKNWLGGLLTLKLLSISYLFVPITYLNNSFLKILNKTSLLFYSNILRKIIGIIILIISINYSIRHVLFGLILYNLIDAIISMVITQKIIGIRIEKQLSFLINNIFLNICFFFFLYFFSSLFLNSLLKVFLSVSFGIVFYIFIPQMLKFKEAGIIRKFIFKS
jgi:teichuronic acid exporter